MVLHRHVSRDVDQHGAVLAALASQLADREGKVVHLPSISLICKPRRLCAPAPLCVPHTLRDLHGAHSERVGFIAEASLLRRKVTCRAQVVQPKDGEVTSTYFSTSESDVARTGRPAEGR